MVTWAGYEARQLHLLLAMPLHPVSTQMVGHRLGGEGGGAGGPLHHARQAPPPQPLAAVRSLGAQHTPIKPSRAQGALRTNMHIDSTHTVKRAEPKMHAYAHIHTHTHGCMQGCTTHSMWAHVIELQTAPSCAQMPQTHTLTRAHTHTHTPTAHTPTAPHTSSHRDTHTHIHVSESNPNDLRPSKLRDV